MIDLSKREKAYFHLPGLFEFYELYKVFLPLFYHHREYFYDWCEIGSIMEVLKIVYGVEDVLVKEIKIIMKFFHL